MLPLALLTACTPEPSPPGPTDGATTHDSGATATHDSGATTDSAGSFGSTPTDTGTIAAPPLVGVGAAAVTAWGSVALVRPTVTDLAIGADGGVTLLSAAASVDPSGPSTSGPAVIRVDPTGAEDATYGEDGAASLTRWQSAYALATAADGGLFVGTGRRFGAGAEEAQVDKLDPTGEADPSFAPLSVDHAGVDRILDLVALDDGGVLVLGGSGRSWLRRYGSDGLVVPFGSDPEVTLPGPCGCRSGQVLILADGTLIAVVDDRATHLDSLGRLDLAYGVGGTAVVRGFTPSAAAVQADGSVVFVGGAAIGTLDALGVAGLPVRLADPDGPDSWNDVAIDDRGRWVLAGSRPGRDNATDALIARIDPAIGLDPTWGEGGFLVEFAVRAFQRGRIAGNGTIVAVGSGADAVIDALTP